MRISGTIFLAAFLVWSAAVAAPKNWYEWSGVAPIVIVGEDLGRSGKYQEVLVLDVLRGELTQGSRIPVDVKRANRNRSVHVDPHPLKLQAGTHYVWLLDRLPGDRREGQRPVFDLVRGVRGARELPAESQEALLAALARFVAIQDQKSDSAVWHEFSKMLEDPSPLLVRTALQQHLKFQRGSPELILSLRPLLAHPDDGIRELGARLCRQILQRYPLERIPEAQALRADLIGLARRDPLTAVRVAATEALAELPQVREILQTIAETDPEQNVRFTAEKRLLLLKKGPE